MIRPPAAVVGAQLEKYDIFTYTIRDPGLTRERIATTYRFM